MDLIIDGKPVPQSRLNEVAFEALSRVSELEKQLEIQKQRSTELEAGIVRMATYQGVLHVLKGA